MDQWTSKASILKDLMEVTQGEVHVNSQNFITTSKPQKVNIEEEIDEELQNIDPKSLCQKITPDLKAIPELLSMVEMMEEHEEECEKQNKEKDSAEIDQVSKEFAETSLFHKKTNNFNPNAAKSTQSLETVIKQNHITSPKHGEILNDPASMFKKKMFSKKLPITAVEGPENVSPFNINEKEQKSSDYVDQLYRELKRKEEIYKKSQETIWTKLYKELEERDRKVMCKQKKNLATQDERKD